MYLLAIGQRRVHCIRLRRLPAANFVLIVVQLQLLTNGLFGRFRHCALVVTLNLTSHILHIGGVVRQVTRPSDATADKVQRLVHPR